MMKTSKILDVKNRDFIQCVLEISMKLNIIYHFLKKC